MHRRIGVLCAILAALAIVVLPAPGIVGQSHGAPAFRPQIEVFAADGVTPIGSTVVHPGDTLVVKGSGFDPNANRDGGFPLPVPPGVPHGTFIAFGAFAPTWKPSAGAPESARATNRSGVKWALSRSALAQVPSAPFDMRRTIRQQWVPLSPRGTFTARVVASTPKTVPAGARYGIYTYGAAGAVNAAQELSVPIRYSTAPGPNTPKPAPRNLIWAYSPTFYQTVTGRLQGSVYGVDGAAVDDAHRLTFALRDGAVRDGNGVLRYRGTVVAHTRFHLLEIAMSDPIIRVTNGRGVLSMRTSTTNVNGTDRMRRVDIADVDLHQIGNGSDVFGASVRFRPGITPEALAALSMGPASPLDLAFPTN
ncbi:HtaA domain-containing protein [Gordonia sp. ABSL49_1]|uniref:HtaA domain-containing protein n=1 Tax=unclassified Gordonia (in: high G+C Gram-positive bacteria) TaxID=2657482 RepID=UPI001F0EDD02|nr:HtaA domain-containing protein [Gordonia sp. ABSL49_1]MCH5641793.1 HtaA domain-containing protein [Gordonia sp. ABSL49_1]